MKKAIIISAISYFLVLLFMILIIVMAFSDDDLSNSNIDFGGLGLSEEVLAYRSLVEKYCAEYGISDYVIYIMAIMQVESGGRGNDVMQASESLGLPLNSLQPEASVKQGCYYFSCLLNTSKLYGCDIWAVVQSYNYGGGFLDYVNANGNKYTFELAMKFSERMANGVKVPYYNAIAIEYNGGFRYNYGNMFYVKLVTQYLGSGFIWPSKDSHIVTSVYGNRIHPISGNNDNHSGIDIGAPFGTNVLAIARGKVVVSEYHYSYGNYIIVDHQNGYRSLYAHMSQLGARVGSLVVQGQAIGLVGSTGNSTGAHIHLEIWKDGERTDPLSYYPESLYTYS